jgi:hypothetical protein
VFQVPDVVGSAVSRPIVRRASCEDEAVTDARRGVSGYICGGCGQSHDELPLAFATQAPVAWTPEAAADERSVLDEEVCIVAGEHYFVRGLVEIPVIGTNDVFTWNAWASLSADNFRRMLDFWDRAGREDEPAYFGWFSSELPGYAESTLYLKAHVVTRPIGQRPGIELEPNDHPLSVEQRTGMTIERLHQLVEQLLHGNA